MDGVAVGSAVLGLGDEAGLAPFAQVGVTLPGVLRRLRILDPALAVGGRLLGGSLGRSQVRVPEGKVLPQHFLRILRHGLVYLRQGAAAGSRLRGRIHGDLPGKISHAGLIRPPAQGVKRSGLDPLHGSQ